MQVRRAIVAFTFVAVALHAQSPVETFLAELNRALQAGDRAAVAAAVHYPLVVSIAAGVRVPFSSASALLERFDEVFTPELRTAVASGATAVVETPEGFILPNQTVTIARVGGQLRISRIVVPPASADDASSTATSRVAPRGPRRIGVRAGPKPSQFAGSLAAGGTDWYVVFVQRGQLLDVRLQRGRDEAIVRVVNAATGVPVASGAKAAFVVTARAAASADYRIEVQRTSSGDAPLPYMLSVRVR
jgi:hypothetical protein